MKPIERAKTIVDYSGSRFCLRWDVARQIFSPGARLYYPLPKPDNPSYIIQREKYDFEVALRENEGDSCVKRVIVIQTDKEGN